MVHSTRPTSQGLPVLQLAPGEQPALQTPSPSQNPPLQSVPVGTNASSGQAIESPEQTSAVSHEEAAGRHIVPATFSASEGHSAETPSQSSAASQGPVAARQIRPASRASEGQLRATPSQTSGASQTPTESRQTTPSGAASTATQTPTPELQSTRPISQRFPVSQGRSQPIGGLRVFVPTTGSIAIPSYRISVDVAVKRTSNRASPSSSPSSSPHTSTSTGIFQFEASKTSVAGSIETSVAGTAMTVIVTSPEGSSASCTETLAHVPLSLVSSGPPETSTPLRIGRTHMPVSSHWPGPAHIAPSKQSAPSSQAAPLSVMPPSSMHVRPSSPQTETPVWHPIRQATPSTQGEHAPPPSQTPIAQGSPGGRIKKGSQVMPLASQRQCPTPHSPSEHG